MLSRLIQRLRDVRSQRRLFTGDRGAIAASLVEIGVAMLAVGILTAGAVTSFTGFIDSASDSTARGRLTDAAATAEQVYNWLRPGGERCYSNTDCMIADASAVAALQEAAGGQLTFAAWPDANAISYFDDEGTIYVQITAPASVYAQNNNATGNTTNHNGIVGDPADGQWIRMAVRSGSGATFCVIKVAHTDNPVYEGSGYMSVESGSSGSTDTSAHCGGHDGDGTNDENVTSASCVHGFDGESTTVASITTDHGLDTAAGLTCETAVALERPGPGFDVIP